MAGRRKLLMVQILVVLLALSLYSQMELTNAYANSNAIKISPKNEIPKKSPMKIKIRF